MIANTKIALIVAIANNNAIGKNGDLLIYLPKDLKWFKQNTVGHTIIMGRKTFQSLPNGALPKRKNIILTRNKKFAAQNCIIVNSIDEVAKNIQSEEMCFVIGGAEIYKEFFPYVDKLLITRIYSDLEADTFFPEIDFSEWEIDNKIENKADEKNLVDFDFLIYNRRNELEK